MSQRRGSTWGSPSRTMSHESRPLAMRARYQLESAGYLRLSFSKALRSSISFPHTCDHSVQLGPPVGEGTGGDRGSVSQMQARPISLLIILCFILGCYLIATCLFSMYWATAPTCYLSGFPALPCVLLEWAHLWYIGHFIASQPEGWNFHSFEYLKAFSFVV